MKAIIYARVSTEEQKKGYSLDAQIEECKRYCELKGWEIVKIYKEVKSAANMKRDELSKAIQMIKIGVADILVAWKLDRITRSSKDFVLLCDEILKIKNGEKFIGIVSVTENIDLTTPIGRAVANIIVVIAQLEREMISERTKMGLKKAKEAGRQIGWKKGKSRIPEWKKDKIIELYKKGATYREIKKELEVGDGTIANTLRNAGLIE